MGLCRWYEGDDASGSGGGGGDDGIKDKTGKKKSCTEVMID